MRVELFGSNQVEREPSEADAETRQREEVGAGNDRDDSFVGTTCGQGEQGDAPERGKKDEETERQFGFGLGYHIGFEFVVCVALIGVFLLILVACRVKPLGAIEKANALNGDLLLVGNEGKSLLHESL